MTQTSETFNPEHVDKTLRLQFSRAGFACVKIGERATREYRRKISENVTVTVYLDQPNYGETGYGVWVSSGLRDISQIRIPVGPGRHTVASAVRAVQGICDLLRDFDLCMERTRRSIDALTDYPKERDS